MESGGTGFNFGNDTQRLNAYVASTERMRKLVAEQMIDVMISNHSGVDLAPSKLEGLRKAPDAPNPFVQGEATVERAMALMNECAQSKRDRVSMMK